MPSGYLCIFLIIGNYFLPLSLNNKKTMRKAQQEKQAKDYGQKRYDFAKLGGVKYYNAQQFAGMLEQQGIIISVATARRFIRAMEPYRIGHNLLVNENQINAYFKDTASNVPSCGLDEDSPLLAWQRGEEYIKRSCSLDNDEDETHTKIWKMI